MEGVEDLGTTNEDSGIVGVQPKGLGDVFQGSSSGGSFIRVRYVGDAPSHGKGPGKLPAQGRQGDNRDAAEATGVWKLGVPIAGYSDGGGGFWGDGSLCPEDV